MAVTVDTLIAEERLPEAYAAVIDRWWRPLAARIADWRRAAGRVLVVGINGAQGTGKSTLCRFLGEALLPDHGLSVLTLSLDDLYLPIKDREDLAREVHPLLRIRGVPGTHDVARGMAILDAVLAGRDVDIPRFSKAIDDRLPPMAWTRTVGPVDVLLFEGWCVGAVPQDECALGKPLNRLEAEQDAEAIWRRYVNAALATDYAGMFARIDRLIMLRPPSFDHVLRNRLLQEHKLRAAAPHAPGIMDDNAVRRFVSHYERLTRHMLEEMPGRADAVFAFDAARNVIS